jgi:hypothetical protein
MVGKSQTIRFFLVAAMVVGLATAGLSQQAGYQEAQSEPSAPIEPLRSGVTDHEVFAQLMAHNSARKGELAGYTAVRTYSVVDLKGKAQVEETGRMEFRAPDKKSFVVTSEAGSATVRRLALNALIAGEVQAASGKGQQDSSITPENYTLQLLGEQQLGPYRCYVAQATPRRKDKYLFEGKVWIEDREYAVVRIEGHPAKRLSFWIEHAEFVRQYQKIGQFWLPQRDETLVHVRLYGVKLLKIEHRDYDVRRAHFSGTSIATRKAAFAGTYAGSE